MHIYIYICICTYEYIYIYIYILPAARLRRQARPRALRSVGLHIYIHYTVYKYRDIYTVDHVYIIHIL